MLAIECALHHPRRIARLVLANSAASNRPRNALLFDDWLDDLRRGINAERWFRTFLYWIFTPRFFDEPAQMDDFVRFALDYPYPQTTAGFAAQVEAMRDVNLGDALAQLDIETLVLCSALDAIFPPGEDAAGLAGLPRLSIVVVPGQAHALHVEEPALFLEPVLAFLN